MHIQITLYSVSNNTKVRYKEKKSHANTKVKILITGNGKAMRKGGRKLIYKN